MNTVAKLDYLLGMCVMELTQIKPVLSTSKNYIEERIKCNERDVFKCRPVTIKEEEFYCSISNFNIGSALKHIFAFTRTTKKRNRPNKSELRVALKYINKEIERLNSSIKESE